MLKQPVTVLVCKTLGAILPHLDTSFRINPHHGLRHAKDLLGRAALLGEKLDATDRIDWRVLTAAACFHDAASKWETHGEEGAAMAREVLSKVDGFGAEEIGRVAAACRLHEDRSPKGAADRKTAGLEMQILYDVDQLEAFGIKGIYRYVAIYTERGTSLDDILPDVRARYESLTFEETRALAKKDFAFSESFLIRRQQEQHARGRLVGAGGITDWIRENPGLLPAELAGHALEAIEKEDDTPEMRYARAFFNALKCAYAAEGAADGAGEEQGRHHRSRGSAHP